MKSKCWDKADEHAQRLHGVSRATRQVAFNAYRAGWTACARQRAALQAALGGKE